MPKISDVIKRLEKLKTEHGDFSAYSKVHDGELTPVDLSDTFVEAGTRRLILNDCHPY